MSQDMCVRANIDCVEETPGQAKTVLNIINFCENTQNITPGASCKKGKEEASMERKAEEKGTF